MAVKKVLWRLSISRRGLFRSDSETTRGNDGALVRPRPEDLNNYQMWTPSMELEKHHKELYDQTHAAKQFSTRRRRRPLSKQLEKGYEKQRKRKGCRICSIGIFGLVSGGNKNEHVPSSQPQAETERAKKMEIHWVRTMDMACGIRNMSNTYFLAYGELGSLAGLVLDRSLDE